MISLIVARSKHTKAIGDNNKLMWRLKNDLRFFKTITKDKTVVMGRKTFESIGRFLPNRFNVILSNTLKPQQGKNFRITNNHTDVLTYKNIFIIGGEQIYDLFADYCEHFFVTEVDCNLNGDSFFKMQFVNYKIELLHKQNRDKNNEYPFEIIKYSKRLLF